MSNRGDSSDDDSFHSASDGEQDSHSSVSTQNSNSQVTSKDDSSEEFVKLTKCKDNITSENVSSTIQNIGFVPKGTNEVPNFTTTKKPILKNKEDSEEDDDWFKTQMDEFNRKDSSDRVDDVALIQRRASKDSHKGESARIEESKTGSIWDWTAIHDVVSAVGEGISNVVETGLGLPNPEVMAKLSQAERRKLLEEAQNIKEPEPSLSSDEGLGGPENYIRKSKSSRTYPESTTEPTFLHPGNPAKVSSGGYFSGGGLFSGLVSGSLDVLESLGKKTFETLTVKDEGDKEKRRFFLQHESSTQNLSDLLRELRDDGNKDKTSSDQQTSARPLMGYGSTVVEKFNTNFVSLFEKSEGMVHLEGLENLSKDQDKRAKSCMGDYNSFNEHLLEFCVEDVSECSTEDFEYELTKYVHFKTLPFKLDNVLEMNANLTQELTLRQAAVDADEEIVVDAIYEAAITALAKLTAHSIQTLHKMAQLIIIAKELPEIESLFAFTYLLCRRLSFFASQYANILSLVDSSNKVDEVVTNIFFECSNACHYMKKALELLRPFFKKIK